MKLNETKTTLKLKNKPRVVSTYFWPYEVGNSTGWRLRTDTHTHTHTHTHTQTHWRGWCIGVRYLWLLRDVKAGVSGSDADEPLGWR